MSFKLSINKYWFTCYEQILGKQVKYIEFNQFNPIDTSCGIAYFFICHHRNFCRFTYSTTTCAAALIVYDCHHFCGYLLLLFMDKGQLACYGRR